MRLSMPKLNILYVITKLELGGAQKQLLNLISCLDKERFQPFLFTAKNGLLLKDALSLSGLTLKESRCLERAINPIRDLLALAEIYLFIKKNNIDIVHTHSSKAGIVGRLAALLAGAKIIIHTVHGWAFNDYQPWWMRKLFIFLERFCANFTHKIIVVCTADKTKGLFLRIASAEKYTLIRYGINYADFISAYTGAKAELGIKNGEPVVGMISCLKSQKSPQDFIRLAFLLKRSLPGVRFILIGEGILRKALERLINKFNLQKEIILTGWRTDIPRLLSAMDVFVLTSLWEGLPICVLEAMAAGKPTVVTDTGGVREVVMEGETGFLVSPRDVPAMASKVAHLLENQKLKNALGKNSRLSLGPDFQLENMVKNHQDLYVNLSEKCRGL